MQFNSSFERRNLKALRIYLKLPSPQWLDYTLRMLTLYTKRTDYSAASGPQSPSRTGSTTSTGNAFDAFKSKLAANTKAMKKNPRGTNDENHEQMNY